MYKLAYLLMHRFGQSIGKFIKCPYVTLLIIIFIVILLIAANIKMVLKLILALTVLIATLFGMLILLKKANGKFSGLLPEGDLGKIIVSLRGKIFARQRNKK